MVDKKTISSIIIKKRKLRNFKLSREDKWLLEAKDENLKAKILKEMELKINTICEKINKINESKEPSKEISEEMKHKKKNYVTELKKMRKDIKDEVAIKKRMNVMKIQKRKLKSIYGKIQDKQLKLKKSAVLCFKCRKRGHSVAECKEEILEEENNTEEKVEKKVHKEPIVNKPSQEKHFCYNCGSKEHNLYQCELEKDYKNLPFAECFICKEKGHISASCPTNKNGIYIKGGSCYVCHKKDHLAKNCPEKKMQIEQERQVREVKKNAFNNPRNNNNQFLARKRLPFNSRTNPLHKARQFL